MKINRLLTFLPLLICGCSTPSDKARFPESAPVAAEVIQIAGDSTAVRIGGYGSSMVYNPVDSCFYLLTDRGPNTDGPTPESKIFPIPGYTPAIGQFRLVNDSLVLLRKTELKESSGVRFTGLPNTEGDGVTGEVAYDINNAVIMNPARGLDSEGLAIGPDGTFWVSDEYGPFILQFDRNGLLLRELKPSEGLPDYFANRRPNRGMEGLTISKDGKRLYGIMQSPLYLPDQSTKDRSTSNRIIEINIGDNATREYIYSLENPQNVVSEICFVNDSVMLVLERDGEFPDNGKGFKKVFKINTGNATDISNREIELLSAGELTDQSIYPVKKELLVDILTALPGYRHDKPEGMTLIGDSILCIVNDDDFGIGVKPTGGYTAKLDKNGRLDENTVYFIPIKID